jgi:hypothetical protein
VADGRISVIETNLRILKRSRKDLRPGDTFVLQMRDNEFIFGRVIRTDAKIGAEVRTRAGGYLMEGCILIYIYNAFSSEKDQIPVLDKNNLLIPPVMTNRLGWSRGYFEVVAHRDLTDEDIRHPHCFYRPGPVSRPEIRRYYDEYDHELPGPVEPCGLYGLASFRVIDDELSDALGIPRVPFDPKTAVLWSKPRKK